MRLANLKKPLSFLNKYFQNSKQKFSTKTIESLSCMVLENSLRLLFLRLSLKTEKQQIQAKLKNFTNNFTKPQC